MIYLLLLWYKEAHIPRAWIAIVRCVSPSPNKIIANATISLPIYFQLPQGHYVCTIFLADTCCSRCQLYNRSNYVSGLALCSLIESQRCDWAYGLVAKNFVSILCFLVRKQVLMPETKKSKASALWAQFTSESLRHVKTLQTWCKNKVR